MSDSVCLSSNWTWKAEMRRTRSQRLFFFFSIHFFFSSISHVSASFSTCAIYFICHLWKEVNSFFFYSCNNTISLGIREAVYEVWDYNRGGLFEEKNWKIFLVCIFQKSPPIWNLITPRHIFIIIFISKMPSRVQKCQFWKKIITKNFEKKTTFFKIINQGLVLQKCIQKVPPPSLLSNDFEKSFFFQNF